MSACSCSTASAAGFAFGWPCQVARTSVGAVEVPDVRVDDEDHAGANRCLVAELGAERAASPQDMHERQRVEEASATRVLDVRGRVVALRKGVAHAVVVVAERKGRERPAGVGRRRIIARKESFACHVAVL